MFLDGRASARGFGIEIFGFCTLAPGYVLAPMFTRVSRQVLVAHRTPVRRIQIIFEIIHG